MLFWFYVFITEPTTCCNFCFFVRVQFFWRRRTLMARPMVKEAGMASLLLENPYYILLMFFPSSISPFFQKVNTLLNYWCDRSQLEMFHFQTILLVCCFSEHHRQQGQVLNTKPAIGKLSAVFPPARANLKDRLYPVVMSVCIPSLPAGCFEITWQRHNLLSQTQSRPTIVVSLPQNWSYAQFMKYKFVCFQGKCTAGTTFQT